jgi:flagellar hook-associated protein 1 FlgK
LKELSGKINITSFEDQVGALTVMSGSGKTLVERNTSWKLTTQKDPTTGFKDVAWEDGSGNLTDITDGISGGKIKALIDIRDKYLENGFIKDLDELAKTIITEVNTDHTEGYNQNGTTGIAFFKEIGGNFARDMDLSSDVKNDVSNIAAASAPEETTGNDIALQIASLIDQSLTINGQTTRMTTYVSTMMSNVGELTRNAQELSEQHQSAMTIMEKQREGVSGVSIDEEMTNLIKFQYAYQAAARLITVADEMFQDLLGVIK